MNTHFFFLYTKPISTPIRYLSHNIRKHTLGNVCPVTIQISLHIHAIWLESSLGLLWIERMQSSLCGQLKILHMSENMLSYVATHFFKDTNYTFFISPDQWGDEVNIFLFLHKNICCGYSFEVQRNKKNINIFFFFL